MGLQFRPITYRCRYLRFKPDGKWYDVNTFPEGVKKLWEDAVGGFLLGGDVEVEWTEDPSGFSD